MPIDDTEAFIMHGPGSGELGGWPLGQGDVTVEVSACGLCQREFGVWSGRIPRGFPDVLGHEVVGRVLDGPLPPGTPVAGMGVQAMARHIRVPSWQLATVTEASLEYSLIEPLSCSVNAVEQDPSDPKSGVVVFGLGLLGQFITELARVRGRPVVGVDNDAQRRTLAERSGVRAYAPGSKEVERALVRAGAAYECTGDEGVLWRLSTGLAPGAALILVAHHMGAGLAAGQLLDCWHTRGIAVRNTVPRTAPDSGLDLSRYPIRSGSMADIPALLNSWPSGRIMRHVVTMD
jgi:threonine dehydrogenase-like Zn-dependent dehydrogenase